MAVTANIALILTLVYSLSATSDTQSTWIELDKVFGFAPFFPLHVIGRTVPGPEIASGVSINARACILCMKPSSKCHHQLSTRWRYQCLSPPYNHQCLDRYRSNGEVFKHHRFSSLKLVFPSVLVLSLSTPYHMFRGLSASRLERCEGDLKRSEEVFPSAAARCSQPSMFTALIPTLWSCPHPPTSLGAALAHLKQTNNFTGGRGSLSSSSPYQAVQASRGHRLVQASLCIRAFPTRCGTQAHGRAKLGQRIVWIASFSLFLSHPRELIRRFPLCLGDQGLSSPCGSNIECLISYSRLSQRHSTLSRLSHALSLRRPRHVHHLRQIPKTLGCHSYFFFLYRCCNPRMTIPAHYRVTLLQTADEAIIHGYTYDRIIFQRIYYFTGTWQQRISPRAI